MGSTTETSVHYVTDTRASQFTVQVFAGGLLSAFGHNPTIAIRDFFGDAQVNPDDLERSPSSYGQGRVVDGQGRYSDKDRREMERAMREEILEISTYPEIVYECSNIAATKSGEGQYSVTLNGELTCTASLAPTTVSARVALTEDSLRAFGIFPLLQTDYDLKLVSVAGGALKVKDELKFSFNILAQRKSECMEADEIRHLCV